jgi:hypothetical protein
VCDLQAELEATNRQVEILSDALAESRREILVYHEDRLRLSSEVDRLKVAQPAPVQEPVAWSRASFIEDDDGRQIGTDEPEISWGKEPPDEFGWSPLYTTPPAAPVQEPKFVRMVDGVPCITLAEHKHLIATNQAAAQRQWVGLAPEEWFKWWQVSTILDNTEAEIDFADFLMIALAVQDVLGKKNTGEMK